MGGALLNYLGVRATECTWGATHRFQSHSSGAFHHLVGHIGHSWATTRGALCLSGACARTTLMGRPLIGSEKGNCMAWTDPVQSPCAESPKKRPARRFHGGRRWENQTTHRWFLFTERIFGGDHICVQKERVWVAAWVGLGSPSGQRRSEMLLHVEGPTLWRHQSVQVQLLVGASVGTRQTASTRFERDRVRQAWTAGTL